MLIGVTVFAPFSRKPLAQLPGMCRRTLPTNVHHTNACVLWSTKMVAYQGLTPLFLVGRSPIR